MNTKKSFKTKSEKLYIDYIDVFSKIEDSRRRFANDKLVNDYLTDSINYIKRQIKQTREALDIVLKCV